MRRAVRLCVFAPGHDPLRMHSGEPSIPDSSVSLIRVACSFAGSNMNVMINDISVNLHTDVQGDL